MQKTEHGEIPRGLNVAELTVDVTGNIIFFSLLFRLTLAFLRIKVNTEISMIETISEVG
jgi:hypothetical protein